MRTETKEPPIHPAFADADAAREDMLQQASDYFESARTAKLNPIADKLSAAKANAASETDATSSRPPASGDAAKSKPSTGNTSPTSTTADAAKIPGPPSMTPQKAPDSEAAKESASPSQLPAPDLTGVPGPNEYSTKKVVRENWEKLHAAKDHWQKQAEELSKRLETAQTAPKANGADPETIKRLETLQSERDNLLARLEAVAVEKSPRFEAAFKPRQEAAIAQAKAAVGPEKAKFIEDVLAMPEGVYRDQQLDAILGDLGPGVRGAKLAQAVADLDRVAAERHAMASRGSDIFKQWQSEEQAAIAKQQHERESQATSIFNSELSAWRDAGYLKNDQEAALAKAVFSGQADYQDAARASIWAVVGPQLASQSMAHQRRIGELEAELTKLRSVQPNAAPDAGSQMAQGDEIPQGSSYSDAIARLVQQSGFLR